MLLMGGQHQIRNRMRPEKRFFYRVGSGGLSLRSLGMNVLVSIAVGCPTETFTGAALRYTP